VINLFRVSLIVGGACTTALGQLSGGGGTIYQPPSMPNVQRIPDVSGDGVADLLVGYPAHEGGSGKIYVFEGPISLSGGRLPLPENAIDSISAPIGFTGFGARIELLSFTDNVDRPDVFVSASKEIDGVLVETALYVHLNPDFDAVHTGYFNEEISATDFYNTITIPLITIDAENVLGPPTESGTESLNGVTLQGGPYADWKEEKPGYQDILNDNGRGGFWDWQRFKAITAGSYEGAKEIRRRYGWSRAQENAFRHAAWQGQLVAAFGRDIAKESGDHHEEGSDNPEDTAVDQYNNEVARQIMEMCLAEGETMDNCINRMLEMIHNEDGTFITDPEDPRIEQILDGTLKVEDIEVQLD
jgi:hypothetical protein